MLLSKTNTTMNEIIEFLRKFTDGKPMVLAVSGGIDSALVYKLASVLDATRLHAYFMPDDNTPRQDYQDIAKLSENGPAIEVVNISGLTESFSFTLGVKDVKLLGNIKARIRMTALYYYSNLLGGIVLGTTNLSEYLTGYFTKFGDGACDIEPIMHLFKSDVRRLAAQCGVPESILARPPSAGLWENQTDEKELGIKYEELDVELGKILSGIETDNRVVEKLYRDSWHKRKAPENLLRGKT